MSPIPLIINTCAQYSPSPDIRNPLKILPTPFPCQIVLVNPREYITFQYSPRGSFHGFLDFCLLFFRFVC